MLVEGWNYFEYLQPASFKSKNSLAAQADTNAT